MSHFQPILVQGFRIGRSITVPGSLEEIPRPHYCVARSGSLIVALYIEESRVLGEGPETVSLDMATMWGGGGNDCAKG
ncbi:MAG: hypothetical protein NWE75_00565 [Candidatus Bathyarchaeota archaeon]|nr:hypothetical protein [Candidatus Bathyarchaeota archaeon]